MTEVVKALPGAYGALNVQVFYDPDDDAVRIIEINPRFGGGYPLTHHAGANFFYLLLQDALGTSIAKSDWKRGVVLLRYDTEVILDEAELGDLYE